MPDRIRYACAGGRKAPIFIRTEGLVDIVGVRRGALRCVESGCKHDLADATYTPDYPMLRCACGSLYPVRWGYI